MASKSRNLTTHHDGHGLNDETEIYCDERDPNAGGASHLYSIYRPGQPLPHLCAKIQFQHGPRNVEGSTPGLLDAALLAVPIDRYEAFQQGPFACESNERVLGHLRAAMAEMKARADERAGRGVLGHNIK